jgi:5-methylthioribose kinase
MTLILSSLNVLEYLSQLRLISHTVEIQPQIKRIPAKNFNLLVSWDEGHPLLVKQELANLNGTVAGDFWKEWHIREFFRYFLELEDFSRWLPEVLHFDRQHSILVCPYLDEYQELLDIYNRTRVFPEAVARTIGAFIGNLHRQTFERQDYHDFLTQTPANVVTTPQVTNLIQKLERITPEVFAEVPTEGLKFFALYQRYDSLGKAIAELSLAFEPCCLTHNDLKLNNILLANDWDRQDSEQSTQKKSLQIIDWERSGWGDPAFDLGLLIASYLQLWLQNLITGNAIAIEESLRLAFTPLEILQPSLSALMFAYLEHFPAVLERRPDFLERVMQFSGLSLIQAIQSIIQHQKSFGNTGICMLQVAKTLLCRPDVSISSILGVEPSEFQDFHYARL